ncbi:MAG TPA: hypothetical protein VGG33_24435, partial [Polyangia bacterium]
MPRVPTHHLTSPETVPSRPSDQRLRRRPTVLASGAALTVVFTGLTLAVAAPASPPSDAGAPGAQAGKTAPTAGAQATTSDRSAAPALPDAKTLTRLSARLQPVPLTVDVGGLPANERAALIEIIRAAKVMDSLFLRQVWAEAETRLLDLARDPSPLGKARLHAFLQNKGPWLRIDDDRPFLPGVGTKPPTGTFYPP